jgi:hypothetical protein
MNNPNRENINTALEIIIRNCRSRFDTNLGRAMADQQIDGMFIGLVCVGAITGEERVKLQKAADKYVEALI